MKSFVATYSPHSFKRRHAVRQVFRCSIVGGDFHGVPNPKLTAQLHGPGVSSRRFSDRDPGRLAGFLCGKRRVQRSGAGAWHRLND